MIWIRWCLNRSAYPAFAGCAANQPLIPSCNCPYLLDEEMRLASDCTQTIRYTVTCYCDNGGPGDAPIVTFQFVQPMDVVIRAS